MLLSKNPGVCVVPFGCLEMHGQHLPVNTDTLIANYVAKEAAKLESVCVFPELTFGDINSLQGKKGSIVLSPELNTAFLNEICDEIARNGFKKIIILNAYGGNMNLLGNFSRSQMHRKKDCIVFYRNSYSYQITDLARDIKAGNAPAVLTQEDCRNVVAFVEAGKRFGHGCIEETAQILKIAPELVRMDRMCAANGESAHGADYLTEVGLNTVMNFLWNSLDSYSGSYSPEANLRIGEALLSRDILDQAEACRRLKTDDEVLVRNAQWNNSW